MLLFQDALTATLVNATLGGTDSLMFVCVSPTQRPSMKPPHPNPNAVVIYCRVSTGEQAREGASVDLQERKCREYAALHDLHVVEVIRDNGQSAKTLRRAGMDHLRNLVQAGAVAGMVIWKLDRLSRSVVDYGLLIAELEAANTALMSVSDKLDTGSASGRLVVNIMLSVSQWEREATAERTTDALAEIRQQGFHVGKLPAGYDRVEHAGKGCLLTPNDGYRAVERVHALRRNGMSLLGIARTMEKDGHSTPGGGLRWYSETVRRALSSPTLASLSAMEGGGYRYRSGPPRLP